jgi:uncharacterized protein YnzC (UPF0291/DUF896 family)
MAWLDVYTHKPQKIRRRFFMKISVVFALTALFAIPIYLHGNLDLSEVRKDLLEKKVKVWLVFDEESYSKSLSQDMLHLFRSQIKERLSVLNFIEPVGEKDLTWEKIQKKERHDIRYAVVLEVRVNVSVYATLTLFYLDSQNNLEWNGVATVNSESKENDWIQPLSNDLALKLLDKITDKKMEEIRKRLAILYKEVEGNSGVIFLKNEEDFRNEIAKLFKILGYPVSPNKDVYALLDELENIVGGINDYEK